MSPQGGLGGNALPPKKTLPTAQVATGLRHLRQSAYVSPTGMRIIFTRISAHPQWIRRQRERFVDDIASMSQEQQSQLAGDLLKDMEARDVHPSIRKRLVTSGWQHPLVIQEMVKYFAAGAHGDDWDRPTPEQLLAVAAEMGDS